MYALKYASVIDRPVCRRQHEHGGDNQLHAQRQLDSGQDNKLINMFCMYVCMNDVYIVKMHF